MECGTAILVGVDLTAVELNTYLHEVFPATADAGYRCSAIGDGWAEVTWTYDPTALRPGGYIPGPTIFTVADLALWFAVFTKAGVVGMAVTTDMTMHFLRPAKGADLVGRATLTKAGRRIAHGKIDLWVAGDEERLVAFGSGAYAIPD